MRLDEAAARLTYALATCSADRAADVQAILTEGAGHLPLPEGAVLGGPAGLVPARREAWVALMEALRLGAVGAASEWDPAAEAALVRAGDWESVLATLVIERDWLAIARTAAELRGEPADEDTRTVTPEETLREAGIDDARQADYQRRLSRLLGGAL